eukprot:360019-Chlamydomonas_euryale.AAC.16
MQISFRNASQLFLFTSHPLQQCRKHASINARALRCATFLLAHWRMKGLDVELPAPNPDVLTTFYSDASISEELPFPHALHTRSMFHRSWS